MRFTVHDTGIGIPEDRQHVLFSPFSQVDGSTTRKYGGTGLGLAISRQLVELMGGTIGLESREGEGSTFWFIVNFEKQPPQEAAPAAELATHQTLSGPNRRRVRILLAEDNPINQQVALGILKKLGYRVDAVSNGLEVVEALTRIPYDLVLMDCQMPEMNGFEATRMIREGGEQCLNPGIPVIALTASAMKGDRERCLAAGMDDYLTKPVQPRQLADLLAQWLERTANPAGGGEQQRAGAAGAAVAAAPSEASQVDAVCRTFNREEFLDRLLDDEELAAELILTFLGDIPRQLARLEEAITTGELQQVKMVAHKIKGATANLGAMEMQEAIAAVEHAAEDGAEAELPELMTPLKRSFERLQDALRRDSEHKP